jgi:hypothetical protein
MAGTKRNRCGATMRQERSFSGLVNLDCTYSRRRTVTAALPQATRGYQSDSSSKSPAIVLPSQFNALAEA